MSRETHIDKYPTITIRINQKIKKLLETESQLQDRSVSEVIRRYIERGLYWDATGLNK